MKVSPDVSRRLLLGEVIRRSTNNYPDKTCLICGPERVTYSEFNSRVNRIAHGLSKLGIKKGDKVAFLSSNCIEQIAFFFAAPKIGALFLPLNFRFKGPEIEYVLNNSDSRFIVFSSEYTQTINEIRERLPKIKTFMLLGEEKVPGVLNYPAFLRESTNDAEPQITLNNEDPAVMLYTSGTTGLPKGVVLSHQATVMGAINIILVSATRADDIYLNTIPLFHVGLTTFFLLNLLAGGTNVLMRAFDPREALEIIQREKVTTTWLVPAMTIAVLSLKDVEKYDLSSLRIWYSGGAILPTEIRNRLMNLLKGIAIFDIFGQTETNGCTTALRHNDGLRKTASVGQPLGTIEIRIVDDEDKAVPPGESGELCYRGPSLFTEYYKNPAETETAWRNGWFHSGDIVRQDEEGFVYVVDRKKDIIVTGGENVASKEVEEVIFQHPKILEAAVIGVPHEKWGETIKAVAVLKPGEKMTEEELINFCKDRVAGYKKPTSVDFIEALPRSSTGKVLKYELRKKYGPAVKY